MGDSALMRVIRARTDVQDVHMGEGVVMKIELHNGNGLNRKYIRNTESQFSYCHRREFANTERGKKKLE